MNMDIFKFEEVIMFRNFNMTEQWNKFGVTEFDVKVTGDKARVTTNAPFVSREDATSRLNKIYPIGKGTTDYFYQTTVNGKKAFFKIPHNIFG